MSLFSSFVEASERNPILVISIDGLNQVALDDYLSSNVNSYLRKEFVDVGVKADYMTTSFPSQKFPNYVSMASGFYPENHNVVGDKVYDPVYKKYLSFTQDRYDRDAKYWNQTDMIWMTAAEQGLKTASSFWIGSEVFNRETDLFLNYDATYKIEDRCLEVVNWFKKFKIDLGFLTITDLYDTGLSFGPESSQFRQKVNDVDRAIGFLLTKLVQANLIDKMNIIIVSDAGLTTWKQTLYIKDYVSENLIDFVPSVYGVVSSFYPASESVKNELYAGLKKIPNMNVIWKTDLPQGLHIKGSNRLGNS
jgi:alkaline phosphatase D